MTAIVRYFIDIPERLALHLAWLGPLATRLVVGYVFAWTGWQKLNNLPQMIQNFTEWGIPYPEIMTPFASGAEFIGGICLFLGLFTRIAGPALVIVMVVATVAAKLGDVDSLQTLLGFEEISYMAMFGWLSVAGPGPVSLDYLLLRLTGLRQDQRGSVPVLSGQPDVARA